MFNTTWLHRLSPILLVVCSSAAASNEAAPVWGPLEISVQSFTTSAEPGAAGHGGVAVENHSDVLSLQVTLRVNLSYADGSQQNLQLDSPIFLDPDTGFVQDAFFPIPQDAALGTATIRAQAVVINLGDGGTHGLARPSLVADQATFEVVAESVSGGALRS